MGATAFGPTGQHDPGLEIQPESSEPLYLQIREVLASRISSGELRPHDKLSSERQLCDHFRVSRMTIRQALSRLKSEGLIYTRQGKGMFVAEPRPELQFAFVLTGYSEESGPVRGAAPGDVIGARVIRATQEIADRMGVARGDRLAKLDQLRQAADAPIGLQTTLVPERLCPGFLAHDFTSRRPIEIIQGEYGLQPFKAEQVVRAGLSDPQEMKRLGLSRPVPVLILERKTLLRSGEVVEFTRSSYISDRVELLMSLDLTHWKFRVGGDTEYELPD